MEKMIEMRMEKRHARARTHSYWRADVQTGRYKSNQVCKQAGRQLCRLAVMQVGRYAGGGMQAPTKLSLLNTTLRSVCYCAAECVAKCVVLFAASPLQP